MDFASGRAGVLGALRSAGKAVQGYGPIFRTLAREHAVLASLMAAIARGDEETRSRLLPDVRRILVGHSEGAAHTVHPRFAEVPGARDVLRAVERNERDLRAALRALDGAESERERRVRFGSVMAAFDRHVRLEEDRLFPLVRGRIPSYEADDLATRYAALRDGRGLRVEGAGRPGL